MTINNGVTWSSGTRLDGGGGPTFSPRLGFSGTNDVAVVWGDFRGGTGYREIYSRFSTNAGSSFSGELRLKTTSGTSQIQQGLGMGEDVAVVYTMVWDAQSGQITSYLDGQLIGTDSHAGDLSTWSNHRLRLGNEAGGKRSFEGVMYDVKLWDRALDGAEVSNEASDLLGL